MPDLHSDAAAFADATAADVDRACRAAAEAFAALRARPASSRAGFLDRIADEVEAQADALVACVQRETALPEARARGELARTCGQLRLFAEQARRGDHLGVRIDHGDSRRAPPRADLRQYRVPLGPVAVFGASNFPLAFSVAGGDTASALAAGCPVVVKAHPAHPRTSARVAEAVRRAAAASEQPAGTFALVHGAGHEVGRALVEHPAIAAVAFTGSFAAGAALLRCAQARAEPIPVFAEMGSVNPMFLLPSALTGDVDALARGYLASLTLGAGQFCTNPGLVFAVRGEALDSFCAAIARIAPTLPEQPMLHAGILAAFRAGSRRVAEAAGVRALTAGDGGGDCVAAQVVRVDVADFLAQVQLAEEVFGPSGVVVELDHVEQMHSVAQAMPGQLTATVHGSADDLARHSGLVAALELRVGRLLFDGFPTGVEVGHAMVHGGPWPATSAAQTTSVGSVAIERFVRPVCYQDCPDALLPPPLRESNPWRLRRLVDGRWDDPAPRSTFSQVNAGPQVDLPPSGRS